MQEFKGRVKTMSLAVARTVSGQQDSDPGRVEVSQGVFHHALLQPADSYPLPSPSEITPVKQPDLHACVLDAVPKALHFRGN